MKLNVFVAGVAHETWFRDTRDERQVTILNCLDRDAFLGMKLKQTFDYAPTQEEAADIDLEKLDGCTLALAVESMKSSTAGRFKVSGKIDRAGVPKEALLTNGHSPAVQTPTPKK